MRILSQDIQSDDGVANAAIAEAADRIDQIERELAEAKESIQRLIKAGDEMAKIVGQKGEPGLWVTELQCDEATEAWTKAKGGE